MGDCRVILGLCRPFSDACCTCILSHLGKEVAPPNKVAFKTLLFVQMGLLYPHI